MKRSTLSIRLWGVLLAGVTAVLYITLCTSCKSNHATEHSPIIWDMVNIHTSNTNAQEVSNGTEKPLFVGDFSLLFPRENEALAHEICRVVLGKEDTALPPENALNSYVARIEQAFLADSTNIEKSARQTVTMTSSILYEDTSVTTLRVDITSRLNDEEAFHSLRYYCFSLPGGEALGERNLFFDGYEETLHSLLVEIAKNSYPDIYFITEELAPNGNFAIMREGLLYSFPTNDVAPQLNAQTDTFELLIPWEMLESSLLANSPVNHLI